MHRFQLGLALAAALGGGRWWTPTQAVDPSGPAAAAEAEIAERPRAPWLQGDPADSIYRTAREALNRRDYRRAAELFGQIPERFPRSGYAADAFYWQAFALYRLGGESQLRIALDALRKQRAQFPAAATRGDAAALERRIQGVLARRGDEAAAADVTSAAEAAAEVTRAVAPAVAEKAEKAAKAAQPTEPTASCEDDSDDIKIAAINALIHMDSERAQPILRRVLARRDPGSVCLRRKAVFLISQGGGDGAEDILLASARTDPDPEVREQAIFWLSQVGTDRAVGALDSILRTSKDPRLQEKAVFALSQQDSPRARQALRAYAERGDVSVGLREQAIFWIGQSGGEENAAWLRQLFGRLKDEELRNKVLHSISQMDGPENAKWLAGVARDKTQPIETRKQALFWAGQAGASLADLTGLYTAFDDREMKEQLIFVYSQRDEPGAVDKLLEIARGDPDPELRKKALFWLGQSDDPRAAKALQDIIEQP